MARSAAAALLLALPLASAAKDANTLVFASFGDWGWSTVGGQNSFLTGALTGTTAVCNTYNVTNFAAAPASYVNCLDGDKAQQASLIVAGLQQVSQIATANVMASVCSAAGSCDFIINTGDNFYDLGRARRACTHMIRALSLTLCECPSVLGIVNGTTDVQWTNAFQNVYTTALFNNTPFLGTLGNHDYSILSPNCACRSSCTAFAASPAWLTVAKPLLPLASCCVADRVLLCRPALGAAWPHVLPHI